MRIYYNSKIAEFITFIGNFSTIMLFGKVFTEKSSLTEKSKEHEKTHVSQYKDCMYLGLSIDIIMLFVILGAELSYWWFIALLLLPFLLFYIWYGIEFLVRWIITRDREQAYEDVSFERQARWVAETWDKPCEERHNYGSFEWMRFIKITFN